MKKLSVLLSLVMVLGLVGFAGAQTCNGLQCTDGQFYFEDKIDDWGCLGAGAQYVNEYRTLRYTHDIRDQVGPGNYVTSAWLELDFTNDWDGWKWFGFVPLYDGAEYVKLVFDYDYATGWTQLGEVDNGQHTLTVDIGYLADGLLNVELAVYNYECALADVWLDHSKLYGCAAPVPEPGTFLLLGAGLVGLIGYRRHMKK